MSFLPIAKHLTPDVVKFKKPNPRVTKNLAVRLRFCFERRKSLSIFLIVASNINIDIRQSTPVLTVFFFLDAFVQCRHTMEDEVVDPVLSDNSDKPNNGRMNLFI